MIDQGQVRETVAAINGTLPEVLSVTITAGESASDVIDLKYRSLRAIIMPDSWTAAQLSFLHADAADGTFQPIDDKFGVEETEVVTAGRTTRLELQDWMGLRFLQIRSGTSAAPVAQEADRIIKVVTV